MDESTAVAIPDWHRGTRALYRRTTVAPADCLISAWGGGWAGALYLDGSTTIDRLLPLSGRILGGLQPVTETNGDGASGLDSVRSEEGSSRTTSKDWDRRKGTDGDQDGTEGGHGLWMFGGQEVQSVGGVQEPGWHVRDGGDS